MVATASSKIEPAFLSDEYRLAEWLEAQAEAAEHERADAASYDPTLPPANID